MATCITKNESEFEAVLKEVMPYIISMCAGCAKQFEFDDMKSLLMIQTWETWLTFDPTKGTKFTTYVFPALQYRRDMELRRDKAKKRDKSNEAGSLDAQVDAEKPNGSTFSVFVANLSESENPEERLVAAEVINIVYRVVNEQLTETARKALLMLLDGETQTTASKACNCAQSLLSYYLKNFRKQLAEALREEGYEEFVPKKFI